MGPEEEEEEGKEPVLLVPGPTAPCLAVPSLQQHSESPLLPPPSSAAAASAVLVDGPCAGPFGALLYIAFTLKGGGSHAFISETPKLPC